jgi:hypothetical protein
MDPRRLRPSVITGLWLATVLAAALPRARADEGRWLFNDPPRGVLQERYGFNPTPEWLLHVQRSSLRFNNGGSGSFISPDGLVMTNHHVGADCLQKLSDEQHNYVRDGFIAKSRDEEKRCVDLELNVLMSIEDVTARINAAVKPGLSPEAAFTARRAVINEIEQESNQKTGLRSDVVTLFQGAQYHLYRYKRYTDVRVVFAPEQQIAFFGGDPDNFEYPRYDLDVCFFRVYEDGKPAKIEHSLKWSASGVKQDELVFVTGHPGRTDRLKTMAALAYLRDVEYPYTLERLYRLESLLTAYSARSQENARRAKDLLFGAANSRKAREGGLAGLLDPQFLAQKKKSEERLRAAAAKDPKLADVLPAWNRIAAAQKVRAANIKRYSALERGSAFNSTLFDIARTLVRAADERAKPERDRLREYTEAQRPSLELELFSTEPLYDDYETLKLASSLTWLCGEFGYLDPLVQMVLAGKSPRERAAELVQGTKLKDPAERRKLDAGGKAAIAASHDPMIELARKVDPAARAVRKTMETQAEEVERQAYAQIARARYAVEGSKTYPDATFTLRLAFGTVRGFEENGQHVPFQTTFEGLYRRSAEHGGHEPFDLPPRWIERKDKLDLSTPLNFVSTADIIGGNSGSPVINRDAEVVGLIFDGNIQSLVLDFGYTDKQARAVAVCSQAITEALRKVYDAGALADEIQKAR